MTKSELEALAYDEAQRLLEKEFTYHNPYTRIIECDEIPYNQQSEFCQIVEKELELKGEKITRDGKFFKINKFQKR